MHDDVVLGADTSNDAESAVNMRDRGGSKWGVQRAQQESCLRLLCSSVPAGEMGAFGPRLPLMHQGMSELGQQ